MEGHKHACKPISQAISNFKKPEALGYALGCGRHIPGLKTQTQHDSKFELCSSYTTNHSPTKGVIHLGSLWKIHVNESPVMVSTLFNQHSGHEHTLYTHTSP